MSISSNSLFHFTNTRTKLFQVLKNGLAPAYCWETISFNDRIISHGFPLISFCDIPLSQVKSHLDKYGNYGIGLTLDWGEKNGLNPVFYLDDQSLITKELNKIGAFIFETGNSGAFNPKNFEEEKVEEMNKVLGIARSYLTTIGNMKNYKGDLKRKNKTYKNYKFYDEKEWRYILDATKVKIFSNHAEYIAQRGKSKEKPILSDHILKFSASNIKYILVKDNKDIHSLLEHIHDIKNLGESYKDIEVLGTKIITTKQILDDF